MAVTIVLPNYLRTFTGGETQVRLDGSPSTVAQALDALWSRYPAIRDRVLNEQGQVREHINIFVGEENVRFLGGLSAAVHAESEITIVPAVSGGVVARAPRPPVRKRPGPDSLPAGAKRSGQSGRDARATSSTPPPGYS